ncbi:DUF4351 domain-containing protein [Castellaniella sp. GW247-6E4]|uniref:DUF4351 domain-containing protein n=1 Tax=Castellaniella sp. GW247-6E4 TaxID=3140380 RepID=UPI003315EA89
MLSCGHSGRHRTGIGSDLHAIVDWSQPPQFLDKELQAIVGRERRVLPGSTDSSGGPDDCSGNGPGKAPGRLYTDKLILVRRRDGGSARLLIHVEVQGGGAGSKARALFARRMFQYRYRLEDRYGSSPAQPIYSLGILTASRGGDSHLIHRDEFLGQGVRFTFPVVHMAQWLNRWEELEALAPANPFAVLVMAQLTALQFRRKAARLDPKVDLMRRLAGYGYARDDIDALVRLVDWMIALPEALEPDYMRALEALEQEHAMTYITTPERVGLRRGRAEGRVEGRVEGRIEGRVEGQAELLLRQLARRFGTIPDTATARIRSATAAQLETWALNILDAETLDGVFGD